MAAWYTGDIRTGASAVIDLSLSCDVVDRGSYVTYAALLLA